MTFLSLSHVFYEILYCICTNFQSWQSILLLIFVVYPLLRLRALYEVHSCTILFHSRTLLSLLHLCSSRSLFSCNAVHRLSCPSILWYSNSFKLLTFVCLNSIKLQVSLVFECLEVFVKLCLCCFAVNSSHRNPIH